MIGINSKTGHPLVSCVMGTNDRPEFIPKAIGCFQAQTYPNRELVIVDHGSQPAADIVKAFRDERIRYEHISDPEIVTGDVKNRGTELARGELIAVWDDDDWSHPARLTVQLDALRRSQADVCYIQRMTQAWPDRNSYVYTQVWRWAATLLAYKERLIPNGSMKTGGDTVQGNLMMQERKPVFIDAPDLYIYLIHGSNVSSRAYHERTAGVGATATLSPEQVEIVKRRLGLQL